MSENMALQLTCAPFDLVCQGGRERRVQDRLAAFHPRPIQGSEPWRTERPLGVIEPFVVARSPSLTRVEIPAQILDIRRPERRGQLLSKRGLIRLGGPRKMRRNQEPNRPRFERSQQFGVSLQEGAKVDRPWFGDDI